MALTRLEFTSQPFANGTVFAPVGPYEELRGVATFALDPKLAQNRVLTDLNLAPRCEDGRVHFASNVVILRPRDPVKRNRRLLLDILNRGRPAAFRGFDISVIPYAASGFTVGDGWLLKHGFTLVWCGWQHDIPLGSALLGMQVPAARVRNRKTLGKIQVTIQPMAGSHALSLLEAGAYVPAFLPQSAGEGQDGVTNADAVLTERDYPYGPQRRISQDRWRFARADGTPDPNFVYSNDGFLAGKVYELRFTPASAPLTGLGFAATRDLVSFLRFGTVADSNPCAGEIDKALAFGASQSGRFLRHMLYLGMCSDERGRLVLDGLLPHIAGGKRTESNWRFGQPNTNYAAPYSPNSLFPFADLPQREPETHAVDGLQARAAKAGPLPKVIYTNTGVEYWQGYAALIHAALRGKRDLTLPKNVRIYSFAGAAHSYEPLPLTDRTVTGGRVSYPSNSLNYRPLLRAALLNLDRWVADNVAPPSSLYPRHTGQTLVTRESQRPFFAKLPAPGLPVHLMPVARHDFGSGAVQGRMTRLPPLLAGSYPDWVSAIDRDGNERGGIRHPDIAVPLGTYTGWNPRHPSIGGADQSFTLSGATIPFAPTRAAREAAHDPRPSIEERYPSRANFLARIRKHAEALLKRRLLLSEDLEPLIAYSAQRYDEFTSQKGCSPTP